MGFFRNLFGSGRRPLSMDEAIKAMGYDAEVDFSQYGLDIILRCMEKFHKGNEDRERSYPNGPLGNHADGIFKHALHSFEKEDVVEYLQNIRASFPNLQILCDYGLRILGADRKNDLTR
jgi:hypothetical protein